MKRGDVVVFRLESVKRISCVVVCVAFLFATFKWGDNLAGSTHSFLQSVGGRSVMGGHSDSADNVAVQSDVTSVTGYGGGGYGAERVNAVPTDIEVLVKEAETLYKTYKKSGNIKEMQMGGSSACVSYGIIDVNNKTDESVDIKALLNTKPQLGNVTKDEPYILIYHTHTTEGYELLDLGWYSNQYVSRTTDESKNMVRVGDELTKTLEDAGYKVIHDRNIYDKAYNGAYDRSRVTVEKYLKQYPSIRITLDVHRDAIQYDNGTKCKPTALINGRKAAQVMIITGCEGDGVTDFPTWKQNLCFALHLQNTAQESYEGLMRPVFFCNRKYNMNVTPCSLLLEFGTDANTLQEAVYSAQLIGNSLVKMLDNY